MMHPWSRSSEGTEENSEDPHDSWCPGRDSNRAPPEYESRAVPLDWLFVSQKIVHSHSVSLAFLRALYEGRIMGTSEMYR
jgi:hypothetical protein